MKLTALLTLQDGVAEQGRPVKFTLRYTIAGKPMQRQVQAVMLPVPEPVMHEITTATKDTPSEFTLRLMKVALRDPGDLSQPLIADETDLQALRDGLVGPQYGWLGREYRLLIADEYPGTIPAHVLADLRDEADDFSKSAQDAPV